MTLDVLMPSASTATRLGHLPGVTTHVLDSSHRVGPEAASSRVWVPPFLATIDAESVAAITDQLPELDVVQLLSAGAERYVGLLPDGVVLCNARGAHTQSTAEWVLTAILASIRQFPRFIRAQAEGRWDHPVNDDLAGRRVLIVGAGDIGQRVAQLLRVFEVETTLVARTARDGYAGVADLPALLPEHEVVVLLVPSTPATSGLVDAEFLAAMPDGALLVNAARGPVVRTDDLLAELVAERLHAAVDVTDPEPLPPGHPMWSAPNLLLTPHVAGSVPRAVDRAVAVVRAQLERLLAGEPLQNVIAGAY